MPAHGYQKIATLSMPPKFFKALERCLAKVDLQNHSKDFEMLFVIYETLRKHHEPKKTTTKLRKKKK